MWIGILHIWNLVDPGYFERVGVRFCFEMTTLYSGRGNNIHGTSTIYNHFQKSFPTPHKSIEDGGMFSLIVNDWVG